MTEKKVVIVTGASQGIGAGLVQGFLENDYRVVATSRSIKSSDNPDVLTVAGDIGEPAVAEKVVRETMQHFGRIDTLINNAGIFISKPFLEYTKADYDAVTGVNVSGFFFITQCVAKEMVKVGAGHILNITTSLLDVPRAAVPAALTFLTKGGLAAVTRGLAIELAPRGIRVNAISPGVVKTPMHDPASFDALAKMHPLGRTGEIKDMVDAVLYLENALFVSGEILHVDGGQSAGQH